MLRYAVIFLLIYIAWSMCVDILNLGDTLDDEAVVPCLFFLPPIGFFIAFLTIGKIVETKIALSLIAYIRRKFKKGGTGNGIQK